MAEINCTACQDLKETSPELVVNGFSDEMCASLANNTGLNPSDSNDSNTDLHNLNDCLVGNEEAEVELFEVCDWKEFMRQFIPNVWTTLKAIICSLDGAWKKAVCAYNGLVKLVDILADTTGGMAFVTHYRDLGAAASAVPYWDNITDGFHRTLDIYMDSDGADAGSQVADRDYVVIISNCTNYRYFRALKGRVTFYSSGDTRSIEEIRTKLSQHPDFAIADTTHVTNFSWTTSGAVLLKKGEHIKVDFYVTLADKGAATASEAPSARLHQFTLTWIPINVSEPLDPSDIINC